MKDIRTEIAEVRSCMELFDFLQERRNERYTRFEAYCYLLDKACRRYTPPNIPPQHIPKIAPCQFFITKTELADDWHWHRATVRDFLNKLATYGQIRTEEHLKGTLCTMPGLTVPDAPFASMQMQMLCPMAKFAVYCFLRGNLGVRKTAMICEQVVKSAEMLYLVSEESSDDLDKRVNLQTLAEQILIHDMVYLMLNRVAEGSSTKTKTTDYQESIEQMLYRLFGGSLAGNWRNLLTIAMHLPQMAESDDYSPIAEMSTAVRERVREIGKVYRRFVAFAQKNEKSASGEVVTNPRHADATPACPSDNDTRGAENGAHGVSVPNLPL